jgi:hypothetical protein
MRLAVLCLISINAQAVTIPTIAGIASIAASSTQIVKEGHNLFAHPWRTLKKHGADLKKAAVKGQNPPPAPVAVPVQPEKR